MSEFLHKYAVVGLACALIGVVLSIETYRRVAIQDIVDLGQRNNVTYGRIVLRQIGAELGDYLDLAANMTPEMARATTLPHSLDVAISDLTRALGVARVRIYSARGLIVFSSRRDQIGENQSDNEAFRNAMRGDVTAKLVYRDMFNSYDRATDEDNLLQTGIPVRMWPTTPVQGVLEIYNDVGNLVRQTEEAEFWMLATGAMLSFLLCVGLLLFARRGARIIDSQRQAIRERNVTLAKLSEHMLEVEENRRKRWAVELHEGVAQTLSAISLALESSADKGSSESRVGKVGIVPILQRTIRDVQSLAAEMRPPSLDELGLMAAISALCREVSRLHPYLEIRLRLVATESEIPNQFWIAIYRSLETALNGIAWISHVGKVHIEVRVEADVVVLVIDHCEDEVSELYTTAGVDLGLPVGPLSERVILSGGDFFVRQNDLGGTTLRAQWPLSGSQ